LKDITYEIAYHSDESGAFDPESNKSPTVHIESDILLVA